MLTPLRLYPALLVLVGVGSLATAYSAQYGFDLEPCILCLYQRIPFGIAIVLGTIGLARPQWLVPVFILATLAFGANSGIAFYHFGVEQHWWASVTGCGGGDLPKTQSAADILASIGQKQPKSCDAVDWTFLGVSMAGWNIVFSGGLAVVSGYVLKTRKWEA